MTKKKLPYYALFTLVSIGLAGCGGSSSNDEDAAANEKTARTAVSVKAASTNITYKGDAEYENISPSTGYHITEDGQLGMRVNGLDLGDGSGVQKPTIKNLTIKSTSSTPTAITYGEGLECTEIETGSAGIGDKFDIVVSLDSSASMGRHASNFADKIVTFAGALKDQGLDVRFAGVTLGDAFATLSDSDGYTSSTVKGTLGTPPSFDSSSRPDTGRELISATAMQEFFTDISDVIGTGLGGGDSPENYLAPIDFFNNNLNFRSDAGRFYIAIGDNCAHTSESFGSRADSYSNVDYWKPRNPEDIKKELINDGAAVNLIWSNRDCSGSHYDMRDIQQATGGIFTLISDNVELESLPTIEAVGSKRHNLACTIPTTEDSIEVAFDVLVGDSATWSIKSILELN